MWDSGSPGRMVALEEKRGCWVLLGHPAIFSLQGQYCDICTAANSNKAHPVSNAIDGTERWWQSPPLSRGLEYNEVNVTLDLGQVRFIFVCRSSHKASLGHKTMGLVRLPSGRRPGAGLLGAGPVQARWRARHLCSYGVPP